MAKSIKDLKRMVTLFLATIINGIDKFPYGILYMAKVLFSVMKEKFPEALDKDLLKVVGNLIYYRYIYIIFLIFRFSSCLLVGMSIQP